MNNVGLFDVLEHIEKDESFLKAIYNKMKKNGHLFLTVPAYNALWSNEDIQAGHFRRYTHTHIKNLFLKTGFKPVYSTYLFAALPLPIFLLRTLPSLVSKNQKVSENQVNQDHQLKGIIGWIIRRSLQLEMKKIKKAERVRFGSSCMVAVKPE